MARYHAYGLDLSDAHMSKLAEGMVSKRPVTIRLTPSNLEGGDELMLTQTQINGIMKAMELGRGYTLKISKAQSGSIARKGSGIFSTLFGLGKALLPSIGKLAKTIAPSLFSGLVSGASEIGIKKALGGRNGVASSSPVGKSKQKFVGMSPVQMGNFGDNTSQSSVFGGCNQFQCNGEGLRVGRGVRLGRSPIGGASSHLSDFEISPEDVARIVMDPEVMSQMLDNERDSFNEAGQSGSGLRIRTQSGGFLGTLLASIGIPLLMKVLGGSNRGRKGGAVLPPNVSRILADVTKFAGKEFKLPMEAMNAIQLALGLLGNSGVDGTVKQGGAAGREHIIVRTKRTEGGGILGTLLGAIGSLFGADMGKKKSQKGQGLLFGKNSPFNSIPLLGAIF